MALRTVVALRKGRTQQVRKAKGMLHTVKHANRSKDWGAKKNARITTGTTNGRFTPSPSPSCSITWTPQGSMSVLMNILSELYKQ